MKATPVDVLKKAYRHFNTRELDAVLPLLHPGVQWPKAWEGGYVQGPEAVKEYWLRQGEEVNAVVEPRSFHEAADGGITVEVHQVVKDLSGKLLVDTVVLHTYFFKNGLIERMEISSPPTQASNP